MHSAQVKLHPDCFWVQETLRNGASFFPGEEMGPLTRIYGRKFSTSFFGGDSWASNVRPGNNDVTWGMGWEKLFRETLEEIETQKRASYSVQSFQTHL